MRYATAKKPPPHARARSAAKRVTATAVSFAKHLVQSSLAVLAILILAVVGYGLLLRAFSPKPLIVVDPFEVPAELGKEIGLDGKNASDIFIDQVNETAKAAQAFRGSEFSSKRHYGHVSNLFRVPVQSSYGLQISGISIDDLVGLYRRVRYDQWRISGDVFKDGPNIAVRVRIRRGQDSQDWEISPAQGGKAEAAVRSIAQQMLTANQPEAMGRAYLEWGLQATDPARRSGLYVQAIDNFRNWAMSNPENPLPFYYMALAYHFHGEQQNSVDLARWSMETAAYAREWARADRASPKEWMKSLVQRPDATDKTVDYDHWLIANAKLQDSFAQDEILTATAPSQPPDKNLQTQRAQRIEDTLSGLVARYPMDLEYKNDFAVSTSNPAKNGDADARYANSLRAVMIQREVVRREPDNPGFQTNLASELLNLAAADHQIVADTAHPHPGHPTAAAQKEIVRCMWESEQASARAIHLLPDSDRALQFYSDVVLSRDDIGAPLPPEQKLAERNQGIRLYRTAILLSPGSAAIKKMYAYFLLNLFVRNRYASTPEKTVLPDVEKNKATRLVDENSIQQALQQSNDEIVALLAQDKTLTKEERARNEAQDRATLAADVSQLNQELGLDNPPAVAPH